MTTILLTSCVTIDYEEPTSGERAKVRYAVVDSGNSLTSTRATAYHFSDKNCSDKKRMLSISDDGTNKPFDFINKQKQSLGINLMDYNKGAVEEVWAKTNTDFITVLVGSINGSGPASIGVDRVYACAVKLETKFDKNKEYEFVYFQPKYNVCEVKMNEIVKVQGIYERRNIKTFINNAESISANCQVVIDKIFDNEIPVI